MRYRITIVLLLCLAPSLPAAESSPDAPEGGSDHAKTKSGSVLLRAEKSLRSALSNLGEEVTFEYAEHSSSLTVKYQSRKFMVHGGSKTGAFSEKPHEVEGPDVKGFLLRIHAQDKGTVNQAVVPQTIRQPYWRMDLDVTTVPDTGHQLYWALAYGSRTDETLLKIVRDTVRGLGAARETNRPGEPIEPDTGQADATTPVITPGTPTHLTVAGNQALGALASKDFKAAYKLVAPSSKKNGDPIAYQAPLDYEAFLGELAPHVSDDATPAGGLHKFMGYKLGDRRWESPDRFRVLVTFQGWDNDEVLLVREDGKWYVADPIHIIR